MKARPRSRESVTLGHGDFRLNLTRAEAGLVTAALAIAANEYAARSTGANTTAGKRHHAAIHLHRRITAALTKGHDR